MKRDIGSSGHIHMYVLYFTLFPIVVPDTTNNMCLHNFHFVNMHQCTLVDCGCFWPGVTLGLSKNFFKYKFSQFMLSIIRIFERKPFDFFMWFLSMTFLHKSVYKPLQFTIRFWRGKVPNQWFFWVFDQRFNYKCNLFIHEIKIIWIWWLDSGWSCRPVG